MWPSLFAESVSRNSCLEWDAVSCLRSLHSTENPGGLFFGYPGFWVVDMFDWLLVGLAALDQHDEGYHYERCSRCCCGGD